MSDEVAKEIRSVLISLHESSLLLPNASVAEVIDYRLPKAIPNAPDWLIGSVTWRQTSLPVVQVETLLGKTVEKPGVRQRIAVCHALNADARFPYIGVVSQGIPRLVRLREEHVEVVESVDDTSPVYAYLNVEGESAFIPNLSYIESSLSKLF